MTVFSRIAGTGSYLPEKILTNHDISKLVDTSHEWIVERTGIHERRIAHSSETVASMAERAANEALSAANLSPIQLDLIVVATSAPDVVFPSVACQLQSRLGARNCPAFDIQAACSGFIFALSVADKFIRSGAARNALVVGSEINSRIVDWSDRSTCILFGDGAGAVILQASSIGGVLGTHLHSDGRFEKLLFLPNRGKNSDGTSIDSHIVMHGNEVFKMAVSTLGQIVDETLEVNNIHKEDIDWLVPHQANMRIISATAKKLAMPLDKVVLTIAKHGNTSSASIPLAFDEAVRDRRIKPGNLVLMEAFGAGFSWGSALIRV